jgi:3-oxoacyl-[acyl-carrier protein] reductase
MADLSRSVEGRVVVVTGAASGMGRAIAMLFGAQGARVAAFDRDGDGVAATADAVSLATGIAYARAVDVTRADEVAAAIDDVVSRLGPVGILVNNAGISLPAPIDADGYDAAWDLTIAVNLTAYARMVRACRPHLVGAGGGRIVNIASTEGLGATPFISPYTASKHGVVGLTRSLAVELGPHGVTVNCVCPGPINTGMTAPIPDEAKERFARRRVPLRRYGEPEEVAHMVLNLALPSSSFVNGAVVTVDGGLSSKFG